MWESTTTKSVVLKTMVIWVGGRVILMPENDPLQDTSTYTRIIPFRVWISIDVPTLA